MKSQDLRGMLLRTGMGATHRLGRRELCMQWERQRRVLHLGGVRESKS